MRHPDSVGKRFRKRVVRVQHMIVKPGVNVVFLSGDNRRAELPDHAPLELRTVRVEFGKALRVVRFCDPEHIGPTGDCPDHLIVRFPVRRIPADQFVPAGERAGPLIFIAPGAEQLSADHAWLKRLSLHVPGVPCFRGAMPGAISRVSSSARRDRPSAAETADMLFCVCTHFLYLLPRQPSALTGISFPQSGRRHISFSNSPTEPKPSGTSATSSSWTWSTMG